MIYRHTIYKQFYIQWFADTSCNRICTSLTRFISFTSSTSSINFTSFTCITYAGPGAYPLPEMTLILTKLAFYRSMLLKLDSFWINSTWKRIDLLVGMTKKSWLIIFTAGSLNWTYINHTGHTFDTLDIRRVTLLKTLGYAQTLWWRKSAQIVPGRIICQNLQKQNGAWLPPRQTEGSRNPKNIWRMAISRKNIYLHLWKAKYAALDIEIWGEAISHKTITETAL